MSNVKKILYPILLGLILISGLYVMGAIIETSSTNITIVSAISAGAGTAGDLYDVVQKNGTTARYNLTIMLDDALNVNITGINITIDNNLSVVLPGNASIDVIQAIQDSFYANDSTLFNANGTINVTRDFGKGTAEIFFGGTTNATYNGTTGVIVSVNLTAQASDEAGGNIDLIPVNWAIRLNLSNFSKPTFNLTTYIDASAPRISDFNLSDGNTTMLNSTYNYFTVMSNNTLTATVVVTESNLRNINMYYACAGNETNASVNAGYGNVSMSTSDTASPYLYTATIANADCIENNETQNNLTLIVDLNDRVGFKSNASFYTLDDAAESTSAYRFIINSTIPTVRKINITDAAGGAGGDDILEAGLGRLDGTGDFLATNTLLTITIEVAGKDLANESRLFYIVNSSVGSTLDDGFFDDGIQINLINVSGNVTDAEAGIVRYNGTIPKGWFNDTAQNTTVNFLLMVNGSGNRYTYRYRGAFGVDGSAPTPTLTAPADTSIDVQHEIAYKCSGEDSTGSGVASCLIKFTKPDGTILSYTTCNSKTISGVDTGQGGTYTVNCKATDDTGNSADTASKTFTVIHNSAGSSGGGSGSSGGAAAVVVDVDLTSADSANIGGYTGNVKTFTFGGATHTIKFTEIGDDSVTITIQSNPVVVGLKVGETKKVDLNNDGVDDLEVTLNKITSGKADVTMNKLTEGALKLVEEEKAAAEETPSETPGEGTGETPAEDAGETPTENNGLSTGMIVAIIIIIVALAGIGYWFIRKRN